MSHHRDIESQAPRRRSGASGRAARSVSAGSRFLLLTAVACGSGEGHPDEQLRGLVHAEKTQPAPIDLDRASSEVAELQRALALSHATLSAAIGPHQFRATSSVEVVENGEKLEELGYETSFEYDAAGNYHALANNSKDYGRELFHVGEHMYLRPRYAPKFHKRAPTDDAEPGQILGELFGELSAYFDVVAAGAELVDRGHAEVSGRAGRKIEIKSAPEAATPPAEKTSQRKWREDVIVRTVKGEVVLDAEVGGLLEGNLEATAVFTREARQFEMKLSVRHQVSAIGATAAVAPPPEELSVATPEHHREVFEREQLLRGIAPPAKKAPTPKSTDDASAKSTGKK